MSDHNEIGNLHSKYMALAYSGTDTHAAREIAKQILKLPIGNARDFNLKIKILETELLNPGKSATPARYDVVELLAIFAQSEFQPATGLRSHATTTRH